MSRLEVDLDRPTAGAALVAGYLLLLAVLYAGPGTDPGAATESAASTVFFVALPVGGLLAGVYALADGPFAMAPLFLAANYLAVFGLSLALGVAGGPPYLTFLGVVVFGLGGTATIVGLRAMVEYFEVDLPVEP